MQLKRDLIRAEPHYGPKGFPKKKKKKSKKKKEKI
jgi:hypothetical protein